MALSQRLVGLLVVLFTSYVRAQNCTEEAFTTDPSSVLEETIGLVADIEKVTGLQVVDNKIVCLANDSNQGEYRYASVVVQYSYTETDPPDDSGTFVAKEAQKNITNLQTFEVGK